MLRYVLTFPVEAVQFLPKLMDYLRGHKNVRKASVWMEILVIATFHNLSPEEINQELKLICTTFHCLYRSASDNEDLNDVVLFLLKTNSSLEKEEIARIAQSLKSLYPSSIVTEVINHQYSFMVRLQLDAIGIHEKVRKRILNIEGVTDVEELLEVQTL